MSRLPQSPDFSSPSPINTFVPRSYHSPPDESDTGGGGGSYGNAPSSHRNPGVTLDHFAHATGDTLYLPQRGYQHQDISFFPDDENLSRTTQGYRSDPELHFFSNYQQNFGVIHDASTAELYQQGLPRTVPHDSNHLGREPQQWSASSIPGYHGHSRQQLGMQFLDHELFAGTIDRYNSESPPSSQSSGYGRRGFFPGQEHFPFAQFSNSPSPSSDYGSIVMKASPGSSTASLNPNALHSPPPASDPQIEDWLRREVGIPPNLPVSLRSVEDSPPSHRPPLALKWIMALAIYGSSRRMLTLNGIYEAVEQKYPYYRNITDKKWQRSMRHSLSLYKMFTRVARPISEAGKGGYWELIYNPPSETLYKRQRKRRSGSGTEDDDEVEISDEGDWSREDQSPRGTARTRLPNPYPVYAASSSSSAQRMAQSGAGSPSPPYPPHLAQGQARQQPTFGQPSLLPQMTPIPSSPPRQMSGFDAASGQIVMPHDGEPHGTNRSPYIVTGKPKRRSH